METTMQPQEATKEPMIELDTGGNAVDVELKEEKETQVEEQKDDKAQVEEVKETKKEDKKECLLKKDHQIQKRKRSFLI